MTGQYLGTDRGVEPPTPGPTAIHDTSNQGAGFGYFSYFLNPTTRLSLITGSAINHFQIPANPDQPQVFALAGVPVYPSAKVRENQFEQNYFNVLALQGTVGENIDYQIAPFSRYSTVTFNPDHVGDLIYNGAASKVFRSDWGNGFQVDTAYHGIAIIRFGWAGISTPSAPKSTIMSRRSPQSAACNRLHVPISIVDDIALQTWIYSVYIQDEWKPTEKLTINYGVRFDLYDGLVRADQASPACAFEYKLFKGTTLHAGYARQFTPPETELVSVGNIKQFENTTGAPAFQRQRHSDGRARPFVRRRRDAADHSRTERRNRFLLQEGSRPDRRRTVRAGADFRDLQLRTRAASTGSSSPVRTLTKISTPTRTSPTASRRARRSNRGNSTSRRTN